MTLDKIPMLPITLANEQTIRPWYDKVRDYCQAHGVNHMLRTVARLRATDTVLHDLIDEAAQPSPIWIERNIRIMMDNDEAERTHDEAQKDRAPLTREHAEKIVREDHAKTMRDYFANNPNVAKKLYFDFGAFPSTLAALKVGRDVIIACADYDAVDAAHGGENAAALADASSAFWQSVEASEVAAWINNFRAAWE